jgi:hypothetical protein
MTLTKSDLSAIKQVVIDVTEPRFKKLEKGQAKLENGQKKIQKDLKTIVNSFDSEYLGLKKRVVRVESHLGLQPPEF